MKKLKHVLLILTFVFMLTFGMNASAASSPSLVAKSDTINAKVGDEVSLEYTFYRAYKYEKVTFITYNTLTGKAVATAGHTFGTNTASTIKYTLTWDTSNFSTGKYKVVGTISYSNAGVSYTTYPVTTTVYINLTCVHSYSSSVIEEPTCGKLGTRLYKCSKCGKKFEQTIDATGNHTYELSDTEEATCSNSGYQKYTCTVCGDSYEETIPATGKHSYESWVSWAATCSYEGEKTFKCSVCGDSYEETIPATGKHTYGTPEFEWSTSGGTANAVFVCTSCSGEKTVKATITSIRKTYTIKYTAKASLNGKTYTSKNTVDRTSFNKNEIFTSGNLTYKVTSVFPIGGTVSVIAPKTKSLTSVKVPNIVKVNNLRMYVTSIADNAFKDMKKLKTVTIGDNVTKIGVNAFYKCTSLTTFKSTATDLSTIGAKAFYSCKKLGAVTLKTKKLTKAKVGSSAFKGIKSTCVFKVPASKVTSYKSIFKAKGAGKKITVKKYN